MMPSQVRGVVTAFSAVTATLAMTKGSKTLAKRGRGHDEKR